MQAHDGIAKLPTLQKSTNIRAPKASQKPKWPYLTSQT